MNAKAELFIDSRCELGEGPIWHPARKRFYWFDIPNQTLLSADADGHLHGRYTFKDTVAAAAIIDDHTLLVAQANALLRYDIASDTSEVVLELEDDLPGNRTNDSRTNLAGGFWVGTMNRRDAFEPPSGSVYQYRGGELTRILTGIGVPNSTCFAPDGRTAYFADSHVGIIRRCEIDPETGLPVGPWEDFVKVERPAVPDGSIVDSEGYLWNAEWKGWRVVRYAPDGSVDRVVELPVSRVTCPCLGGDDLRTLFITSAREPLTPEELEREPYAGSVFALRVDVPGQPEPILKL